MSTSPEVSQYQAANAPESTFQPSVSSSDSDYSDEKQAVATYQSTYGIAGTSGGGNQAPLTGTPPYPTLSMAYTTAPDLMPQPQTNGSSGSGSSAPEPQFPVFIELGTLMSTEGSFLGATSEIVNEYENTLMPLVQGAMGSGTFFGQNAGISTGVAPGSRAAAKGEPTEKADPLNQEATKFAAAINPQMSYLMQQIGTLVEALGVFTSRINTAGQYYTDTDAQSVFPPPGLMEGPNPLTGPSTSNGPSPSEAPSGKTSP
jgi:hypothetical protein